MSTLRDDVLRILHSDGLPTEKADKLIGLLFPTGPDDKTDAAKLDDMAELIVACVNGGLPPSKATLLEALKAAYALGAARFARVRP
jgi:hypothetical protein